MLGSNPTSLLLASDDSGLLSILEPALAASRFQIIIVRSAEAALEALLHQNGAALLDERLPVEQAGMNMSRLLAAANAKPGNRPFPIVLITDSVNAEWTDRLSEGIVDDLIPRSVGAAYTLLRVELAVRAHSRRLKLESLQLASVLNEHRDPATGVCSRATLISMLFRETDRVQRMKTSLCLIRFDIDDYESWNSQLRNPPGNNVVRQVVNRTMRLMRSYDLFGQIGKNEFLLALPGCDHFNAIMLAERLRMDVFANPFQAETNQIRLSACFGIASSNGRSPMVVLQDVEQALRNAKSNGPGSVACLGTSPDPEEDPAAFLSFENKSLAW